MIPRIRFTDDQPAEGPVAFRREDDHVTLLVWRGLPPDARGEAVREALRIMREDRRRDAIIVLGAAAVSDVAHMHPGRGAAASAAVTAAVAGVAIGMSASPPVPPAASGPQPTITRVVSGPFPATTPAGPHGARPARAAWPTQGRFPVALDRATSAGASPVPGPRPEPSPAPSGTPQPTPTGTLTTTPPTPPPRTSPPPTTPPGQHCVIRVNALGIRVRVCELVRPSGGHRPPRPARLLAG